MNPLLDANGRERIIVALDVPDIARLEAFLDRLEGKPVWYKIGLELFIAEGVRAIEAVKRRGGKLFLDLKLHDIPETVARSVTAARRLGAELLTVHAGGGTEMVGRAVAAAEGQLNILAVTVLTSQTQADLVADGIAGDVSAAVARRAQVARDAGAGGLVCSPQEVALARAQGQNLLLVVPGIRPTGSAMGDQKRVGTPAEAIAGGADYLVVGRPLRDAQSPSKAFDALAEEIDQALKA